MTAWDFLDKHSDDVFSIIAFIGLLIFFGFVFRR